ncbi:MAG: heat-inducible transcription repressor HrcA [Candidatus Marinimicrobia bacterium]|nr:heat-inducible transcription repressor HrcA [Candidatus Neomarinimicrobiota bacterium]
MRKKIKGILTEREKKVLEAIISDYIDSAYPVSSKRVHKKYMSDISPATIRNTMFELERKGFITQPHISAGRIPTDRGYRYYVDSILNFCEIEDYIYEKVERELFEITVDMTLLIEKSVKLLSEITDELSVFVAPLYTSSILEKIDLISVSENKIMVILEMKSGLVKTAILTVDTKIEPSKLPLVASVLNERLSGVKVSEIVETIHERMEDIIDNVIIKVIIENAPIVFDMPYVEKVRISGTTNLFKKPDFKDPQKLSHIVSKIENGTIIAHIYKARLTKPGIVIMIGKENKKDAMKDLSIITNEYRVGESKGFIGVIGPKRMDYKNAINAVKCFAEVISYAFNK